MQPSQEPLFVKATGLTKIFKDFWFRPRVVALDKLDLSIHPGEVHGLLGSNGAGKSTTIKLLLGLLFPTSWDIEVFGKPPGNVHAKNRIGYLPEESYLYGFLAAGELLDYYARLFNIPSETRSRRIAELLEMVGLQEMEHRPLGEFSKGMQRRIGIAQALINNPDLLIFDEPTTGLDPIGAREVKDLILRLKEEGKSILLSSHRLADVEDVCDRVTVLYGGKKRAEGSIDELLSSPQSTILETDCLDEKAIASIRKVLSESGGFSLRRAESPRQSLEEFFLELVEEARQEGAETSGALTGSGVADFLSRKETGEAAQQPGGGKQKDESQDKDAG